MKPEILFFDLNENPNQILMARDAIHKTGVVVLENTFSEAFIGKLLDAYKKNYQQLIARQVSGRLMPLGQKRMHLTLQADGPFLDKEFYANPVLNSFGQAVLGGERICGTIAAATSFPGAKVHDNHRDQTILFPDEHLNKQLPAVSICFAIPLIKLDDETGATEHVLGSHHVLGNMEEIEKEFGYTCPEVKLGDVIVWDNRIIHRGKANKSNRERPILLVYFQKNWFWNDNHFDEASLQISIESLYRIDKKYRQYYGWKFFNRNVEKITKVAVKRNSLCPCYSGEKYKHCCGSLS